MNENGRETNSKKKIENELVQLTQENEELKDLVKPIAPENAIGRISHMDAINNKSVNESALRKASLRLDDLKQALQKITSKEFGICLSCELKYPLGDFYCGRRVSLAFNVHINAQYFRLTFIRNLTLKKYFFN